MKMPAKHFETVALKTTKLCRRSKNQRASFNYYITSLVHPSNKYVLSAAIPQVQASGGTVSYKAE